MVSLIRSVTNFAHKFCKVPSGKKGKIEIFYQCGPRFGPIIDSVYAVAWHKVGLNSAKTSEQITLTEKYNVSMDVMRLFIKDHMERADSFLLCDE